MKVRQARMADVRALAALRLRTWRETYPAILPESVLTSMSLERQRVRFAQMVDSGSHELAVFCAEVDGTIAAFGICGKARGGPKGFDGEVQELYVASDFYGIGIGRAMMAAMAIWLASRGFNSVFAAVLQQNHAARAFYRKLGGERCGEAPTAMGGAKLIQEAFGWRDLADLSGSRTNDEGRLYPILRRPDEDR
ncbi:MAG: GNAT family N-acetyltransferase [Pseudomonadota bacterium]